MPRLPRVTAPEIIRVLKKLGFALARQTGAHRIYKNAASRRTTVSYHAGRTIHPKTLKSILADAGLTVEELIDLLKDA